VKVDGNDGAHAGTLGNEEAADLEYFIRLLLVRLDTEPKALKLAAPRRTEPREKPKSD